nr:DUF3604 domain-containing protein [Seongchinamella unica]
MRTPLDFTAITDHAEALGEYEICTNPDRAGYQTSTCEGIRNSEMQIFQEIFAGMANSPPSRVEEICGADGATCRNALSGPWQEVQQAAADSYEPGKFTSFVAYELSAGAPEGKGGMMHRNVIFRSDNVPETVFSAFEGTAEELHAWLERECTDDCQVLTIPHNPNFYWGRLYWGRNSDGTPFTEDILQRRARMDRLVEIMQIKGNFEGHYAFNDGTPDIRPGLKPNPTAEAMGMSGDDDPTRLYNPGAITGVWAVRNDRESIWDALYRRETFATSGTRTRIRMFAGYGHDAALLTRSDWQSAAAARGVPQGGDLPGAKAGQAPQLAVWAVRDPLSAPLARLQVIKGWKTASGELKEQTYDIACSDDGKPDPKMHRCPDNGATVNPDTCEISVNKGAAELSSLWTDPDFDPQEDAFYYARVLENPVCRWSRYDAKKAGVEHPADLPATIRERAWSSPVWCTPES